MFRIESNHLDLKKIHESGQVLLGWTCLEPGVYKITSQNKMSVARQEDGAVLFEADEADRDFWCNYFDMNTDYEAIEKAMAGDEFLTDALEYGRGIRILNQNIWEATISFIVSQNNNIPRITKSLNTIKGEREFFPTPEELYPEREKLRSCGLGYRDNYIIKLLEELHEGSRKLEFSEKTPEALKELTAIFGIGPKVANCIMLFGMHHMDCCPVDTWMKKIFENHYEGKMPDWTKDKNAGYYQQVAFFYERSLSAGKK